MLEKTLESSLDCKEIQPVHPKGDQSWVFIGRTDTEAETPILWRHDAKNWLTGKDPDAGKDWRQEEKGRTEDEMVGWHHQLDGHEFEQGLGVGDGQGSLVCCSPCGCKESNMTEWLNWTEAMEEKRKKSSGDFPGGPVAKTPHSQCRGPQVQLLFEELESACHNQRFPHAATKIKDPACHN